jgi:hypothetical protein
VNASCDADRVVTSLAAKRDKVDQFDFFLFEESMLEEHGFRVEVSLGDSVDRDINKSCHLHIVELTETRLLELSGLLRSFASPNVRLFPMLAISIANAVGEGRIRRGGLGKRVDARLVELNLLPPREAKA